MRTAIVAVVLALVAGWAAWPRQVTGEWQPFVAPELVQVVPIAEVNTPRELVVQQGRIVAQCDLDLVFRSAENPRQVSITNCSGHARMFLGDDGPMLILTDDAWALVAEGKQTSIPRPTDAATAEVALRCDGGKVAIVAAGRTLLEQPWGGAPPAGRVGVRLASQSAFASLAAEADDGPHVLLPHAADEGWDLVAWAVGSVLLLVPALVLLWSPAPGRPAVRALFAAVSIVALSAGLGDTVRKSNRDRVAPPNVHCETAPLEIAGPVNVDLYHSLEVEHRLDGDATLEAQVTLAANSVVDVLVRGAPVEMDRGEVVTLSSDPRFPSGTSLNLSTEWQAHDAPAALATLPTGRPLALRVVAEGEDLSATVDGAPLGRLDSVDLRAGRTAFHVLSGSVVVSGVKITPTGAPRELSGLLLRWILTAALGAVALATLLGWLLVPHWRAGLALAPLAVACWPAAPGWMLAAGAAVSAAQLVVRAPRGRRLLALLVAGALGGLVAWATTLEPPEYSPRVLNRLQVADVRGGPMPAEFLWARHPVVRRFTPFVRYHTFRSGQVTEPRAPGTLRIVSLGSSSTYGYGVGVNQTWSAFLQRRLGDKVEVINAGVPASDAECLRWMSGGLIAPLRPDLVIVDLGFNDHTRLPQYPEREHFARFLSTGVGWRDELQARFAGWWRKRDWDGYFDARARGDPVAPQDAERFELEPSRQFKASLRDIAELCKSLGGRMVFVAEPARDKDPILDTFHAAMVSLGEELSIPVVQPQADLDALGKDGFLDMVHPTEKGHRVLGTAILDVLVKQVGIVPPY